MRGCWLEIRSDQVYRLMSDLRWIILIKIISEGGGGGVLPIMSYTLRLGPKRVRTFLRVGISPFSSPEPVVSWSRGRETRGSGSSRYRRSENFWHPVAHLQKLQLALLMLITDFCPSPLHWGNNFTSWALPREWLLWDVLKMHHFTQLGFTDNLELKEEDSKRNRLNTLLVCRTETIGRLSSQLCEFFFSIRLANKHWETNIARIDIMREKVNLKRYLVPCPATAILLQNAFWNETIHVLC